MHSLGNGDPLRLGPYRLLGVLGAGGMGKVFLGRDDAGRLAAVKVLLTELAQDPGMSQRFIREAQTAQAVHSPGVARVLGARTEGGRPWIATEFLAGPTLDEAVERHGPFEEAAVRALGAALAHTLRDIHMAGLVHRDIKPSNVVLTSAGPRVIDFGIARPEHGLTLTATGQVPVSPGYGAPEQVLGRRVAGAADVFSLGAVLAFAAGGRRVYDGGHVLAVQYQVVHEEPDLAAVPQPLRALIEPCLAKDPAGRPEPARLATDLAPPRGAERAWRAGPVADDIARGEAEARELAAFTHTSAPHGARAPSRRGLVTALAAGGTALLAGGGAGALWLLRKNGGTLRQPGGGRTPTARTWVARRLAGTEYNDGAAPPELWGPGYVSGAPCWPLPLGEFVVTGVGENISGCWVTDGGPRWSVPGRAYLAPSADLVVVAGAAGELLGVGRTTGDRLWSARPAERAGSLITADRTTVYFTTPVKNGQTTATLCAFDLPTRSLRWFRPLPVSVTSVTPVWGAAGEGRLVVTGTDGNVAALDARTGAPVWQLPGQSSMGMVPVVSGSTVYLGGKTLTARDLKSGRELWSVRAGSTPTAQQAGWGPPTVDGDLLYATDGPRLCRLSKRDGKVVWHRELPDTLPWPLPPVPQGNTVWVAPDLKGRTGFTAVHRDTGKVAWTYSPGELTARSTDSLLDDARYQMAGADNRVFVVAGGKLSAMPVF
ncbi:serine/threonine-protein kinase [Streptomyces sp. NPDC052396]|uniref:serine/threonine-protein kinase n=1 Tax=Streptomyces sp. NPDC052396 TaxID=3365689 RepID=UPI0037D90E4C